MSFQLNTKKEINSTQKAIENKKAKTNMRRSLQSYFGKKKPSLSAKVFFDFIFSNVL